MAFVGMYIKPFINVQILECYNINLFINVNIIKYLKCYLVLLVAIE